MYVCSECRAQLDAKGKCLTCGKEHTFQTALYMQDGEQLKGFPQQSQQGFPQQGFPQQGFPQQGFPQQPQQGFPQQGFQQQPQPVQITTNDTLNTFALVSLILSCVGCLLGLIPLGAPLLLGIVSASMCIISIYLGRIGLDDIKITGEKGKVLAIIGIILGSVFTGLYVISFLLGIISLVAMSSMY